MSPVEGESLRRAVFLDRDGTISVEQGYLRHPQHLRLLPGAAAAIRALNEAGWLVVVVTNQSSVGRGYLDAEVMHQTNQRLTEALAAEGARLDGLYVCPHAPWDGCPCRKPQPGLLWEAAQALGIDLPSSWMVGDKASDIEAARRAGCRTILVQSGWGRLEQGQGDSPDLVAADLAAAAQAILDNRDQHQGDS